MIAIKGLTTHLQTVQCFTFWEHMELRQFTWFDNKANYMKNYIAVLSILAIVVSKEISVCVQLPVMYILCNNYNGTSSESAWQLQKMMFVYVAMAKENYCRNNITKRRITFLIVKTSVTPRKFFVLFCRLMVHWGEIITQNVLYFHRSSYLWISLSLSLIQHWSDPSCAPDNTKPKLNLCKYT